ncbi:MAG: hypothetical protein ACOCXZ_01695, partial [Chloroflexota bacterium]
TVDAGAAAGSPYSVTVTVTDSAAQPAQTAFQWTINAPTTVPTIESLTLINAATDTDIGPLPTTIDLSATPQINIRANVAGNVGSVVFLATGSPARAENEAPYALAGDNQGDYLVWPVTPGTYTITAVPYSGPNGTGTQGTAFVATVTVISGP